MPHLVPLHLYLIPPPSLSSPFRPQLLLYPQCRLDILKTES